MPDKDKKYFIVCSKCHKEIEVPSEPIADNSTFVCEECQDKINLPAWEKEIAELEGTEKPTESQTRRLAFLKEKVEALNKKDEEE